MKTAFDIGDVIFIPYVVSGIVIEKDYNEPKYRLIPDEKRMPNAFVPFDGVGRFTESDLKKIISNGTTN